MTVTGLNRRTRALAGSHLVTMVPSTIRATGRETKANRDTITIRITKKTGITGVKRDHC